MALPDINLDDMRAQDLLDEARLRIVNYCPEWTDYNVSDPGITLLELFAWKTEKLAYRLNRVPEKTLLRLMDLIGIDRLAPAISAKADLTFRLVTPFPLEEDRDIFTDVLAGTQAATRRAADEPEVTFTTRTPLRIGGLAIEHVLFSGDPRVDWVRRKPQPRVEFNKPFALFGENPQPNDAFYLCFKPLAREQTPAGHVVQLVVSKVNPHSQPGDKSEEMTGSGYIAKDPPWVWEYWNGTAWAPIPHGNEIGGEQDTTDGFNEPKGSLVLYLPADLRPSRLQWDTFESHWVRCRYTPISQSNLIRYSPRVYSLEAQVIGGAVRAENAVLVDGELLGISNGKPGQQFKFRHDQLLTLETSTDPLLDEFIEVEQDGESEVGRFERWQRVDDFSQSTPHSRHYCVDEENGEVTLGPAIRMRDGEVVRHGRVPALGRRIRISRYRYSLGAGGNVKAGKISVLKTAIPYVDRVHNREDARGGLDAESMEEARLRARRIMRTQDRAVTAEDYENLLLARFNAAPERGRYRGDSVARASCLSHAEMPDTPAGSLQIALVAGPFHPDVQTCTALIPDNHLIDAVKMFLNKYRLLTTQVIVDSAHFTEMSVQVTIPANHDTRLSRAEMKSRVTNVVQRLLAPAVLLDRRLAEKLARQAGTPIDEELFGEGWAGWPFGKTIEASQVAAVLMRLPGVRYVSDVTFTAAQTAPDGADSAKADSARPLLLKEVVLPPDGLPWVTDCKVNFA